jgi:hypothetical protein
MNLKDAIGKDKYIIDEACYTDEDLQAMSTDDLETLKMKVANKISGLAAKIRNKQIEYANGGEGASADWYANHKYLLSINEKVMPYINSLLKRRRRAERNLGDAFIDEARCALTAKDFDLIFLRAQKRIQTGGGIINELHKN